MHSKLAAQDTQASEHTSLLPSEKAASWLLDSGILTTEGGLSRYYNFESAAYAPVSTELTGYAVSFLCFLFERSARQRYLDAALHCARFLTRRAWDPSVGSMPFETGTGAASLAYFFDLGIVARGLLRLWRLTRDQELLDVAAALARSMLSDFGGPGVECAVIRLPSKTPASLGHRWSRQPGCYHLKAAMAWAELAFLTADRSFEEACQHLHWRYSGTQELFLAAATSPDDLVDRLHAYCYFLEGLLCDPTNRARDLRDGLELASQHFAATRAYFERADVVAQLLRLRLYAAALGLAPLDQDLLRTETSRLLSYASGSPDCRLSGSFLFGRKGTALLPFANPATTFFAVQALQFISDFQRGQFSPDPLELI